MIGEIFITSTGYDPILGKHVKDPYLGDIPSIGACRPDIRRRVVQGDYIFVVSGKVRGVPQYVMGGFEVDEKINAVDAWRRFPEQRLRQLEDGQLTGNIIVNSKGKQHKLDGHGGFAKRIENYIVGRNPIFLTTPAEVARGRLETLDVLKFITGKPRGESAIKVIGRGSKLNEHQTLELRDWLYSIKHGQ